MRHHKQKVSNDMNQLSEKQLNKLSKVYAKISRVKFSITESSNNFLNSFCSKNMDLLLSSELQPKSLKKEVTRFLMQWKEKFNKAEQRPTNKEIIKKAIEIIVKKAGLSRQDTFKLIESLPLKKMTGEREFENLKSEIFDSSLQNEISQDILKNLEKNEIFGVVTEKVEGNYKKDHQEELEKREHQLSQLDDQKNKLGQQLEKLQEQIEALPSITDSEITEDQFDEELSDLHESKWWQKLNLKSDPFPGGLAGLKNIDKESLNQVYIKKGKLRGIFSSFERNHESYFNKCTPIIADFGNGKTSFLDYIEYLSAQKGIEVIGVRKIKPIQGVAQGLHHIYRQLSGKLKALNQKFPNTYANGHTPEFSDDAEFCSEQLKLLSKQRNGVLIVFEDFHKVGSMNKDNSENLIFEVLAQLQQFKEELITNNVGFFVTGLPHWKQRLRSDTQLTGFVDNSPIELPHITYEFIAEILNERLKTYSVGNNVKRLDENFIKHTVKDKSSHLRESLRIIIDTFENNPRILEQAPIEIKQEDRIEIRSLISKQNKHFFDALNSTNRKKFGRKWSSRMVSKFYELIVIINIQEKIDDDDDIIKYNRTVFDELKRHKIVVRAKASQSSTNPTVNLYWKLSKDVEVCFDLVNDKLNLRPYEYLMKVFHGSVSHNKTSENKNEDCLELERELGRNLSKINQRIVSKINSFCSGYSSLNLDLNTISTYSIEEILIANDDLFKSFKTISDIHFEFDGSREIFSKIHINEYLLMWEHHPFVTTNEYRILPMMFTTWTDLKHRGTSSKKEAFKLNQLLIESIQLLIGKVHDYIVRRYNEKELSWGFSERLNVEELPIFSAKFFNYDSLKSKSEIFQTLSSSVQALFLKFVNFYHLVSLLHYGPCYPDEVWPKDILNYARKNQKSSRNYNFSENLYMNLSYGHIKLLFESKFLNKLLYNSETWTIHDDKLKSFFKLFTKYEVRSNHTQLQSVSETKVDAYMSFFLDYASKVIESINETTKSLLFNYNLNGDELSFNFSYNFKDNQRNIDSTNLASYHWKLSDLKASHTDLINDANVFIKDQLLVLDFLDRSEIEETFGLDIKDVFFSILLRIMSEEFRIEKAHGSKFFLLKS